jgi:hypothetical protein
MATPSACARTVNRWLFRCSIYLEDALNIVGGRSERSDHRNDKERKRKKDLREKYVKNVENEPSAN